jgi:hypothetical protein
LSAPLGLKQLLPVGLLPLTLLSLYFGTRHMRVKGFVLLSHSYMSYNSSITLDCIEMYFQKHTHNRRKGPRVSKHHKQGHGSCYDPVFNTNAPPNGYMDSNCPRGYTRLVPIFLSATLDPAPTRRILAASSLASSVSIPCRSSTSS